jgi:predicted AAA+ superfamily ATPase
MERRDASLPLVIFDEIHKYRAWKNYLKGICDQFRSDYRLFTNGEQKIMVAPAWISLAGLP